MPGVGDGTRYKFEVHGSDGVHRLKADPMAQATEMPPATASRVFSSHYTWGDARLDGATQPRRTRTRGR